MILTWVFRVLFVPLLVLAIITSNCNAAKAIDTESPRINVAGSDVSASDDGTELSLDVRIPLTNTFALDVYLGYLWGDARGFVADVSGSKPDSDVCFDASIKLRPIERDGIAAHNNPERFACRAVETATARIHTPTKSL